MQKRVCAYARYGTDEIPTDIGDPLEVFDATDVSKNVMRFVVYILWLKGQPDSFEDYLSICVSENVASICGETVFINFGDYEEKEEKWHWWCGSTHVSKNSRITQS